MFDLNIPVSTVNLIIMAIRRSQIGSYCTQFCQSISRGNMSLVALSHFVESTLDMFHTFLSVSLKSSVEETSFYLKGVSFIAFFTHNKSGVRLSPLYE